jgi:hypothetical protein
VILWYKSAIKTFYGREPRPFKNVLKGEEERFEINTEVF